MHFPRRKSCLQSPPRREGHTLVLPRHSQSLGTSDSTHKGPITEPILGSDRKQARGLHHTLSTPAPTWHSRLTLDTFFYKHVPMKLGQLIPVGGEEA